MKYLLDYLLEATNSQGIALTLRKPASVELADHQADECDPMPFPVLDACFALYVGEKMTPSEVAQITCETFANDDAEKLRVYVARFQRVFIASIYKWVQTPVSLHVGNLDRERALQLSGVQKSEW